MRQPVLDAVGRYLREKASVPVPALCAGDRLEVVRALQAASDDHNEPFVRSIFENLEFLLVSPDKDLRCCAIEFLEALQDSSAWRPQETDAYLSVMGPGSRRIWSALNAIRSDLADCSVLEAEVGMWRVVHHG